MELNRYRNVSVFLYICLMAKKIIISFTGQPIIGDGFIYSILIDNINLVYTNGQTSLNIDYGNSDIVPNIVKLEATLSETIDKTLSFLIANWISPILSYKRVNNTIEVLINSDDVVISIGATDVNINLTIADVSDEELLKLRYFFQYTNVVSDTFLCEIYKKNYTGLSTEIYGTATLEKGSVKDHLDSIRGTGLSLELEASLDVTLEDLYTQNEQDFVVKFYKNNNILFRGFLKPDGVFQSFVRDVWIISLDCVDGLGALSNLSFVQESGFRFTGKMKASDIVYNCLKRTGISMPINVSINTLYEGLTPAANLDILTKIKMNSDRFFKNDGQSTGDGTLMSCEEVLKSVLDIFCAVITQENGEWYIYKPNEVHFEPYLLFRRYDINNVYIGNVTINTNKILGSQIDNYYPHHCKGDQKIEIKGGISAFRLGYKYSFVSGLLSNSGLFHNGNLNYEGWTIDAGNSSFLINDPLDRSGFKCNVDTSPTILNLLASSNPISVAIGDSFSFKISFKSNGEARCFFRVRIGSTYYLEYDGSWFSDTSSLAGFRSFYLSESSGETLNSYLFEIKSQTIPIDGLAFVEVYVPGAGTITQNPVNATFVEVNSVDFINTFAGGGVVGEFHTVSRTKKISTIVKENKSVSNGDNSGIVYLGAIFKDDGLTTTQKWFRKAKIESYPLLRIAAEEELRIAQKPLKVFRGSVFGFIPYLSLIDVNGVGKFMPIEYSYDTSRNVINLKLLELYSAEMPDILYKPSFDYGNTVKPTIVG